MPSLVPTIVAMLGGLVLHPIFHTVCWKYANMRAAEVRHQIGILGNRGLSAPE
jgi:uncharacterized membrane protein